MSVATRMLSLLLIMTIMTIMTRLSIVSGQSQSNAFPDSFLIGFATASYQIEGGWNEDGKGENIWDRQTHCQPNLFKGEATGDTAADSYHKYKEDVAMLKNLGAQVYRFSLSWARILPTGDTDFVNQPGIDYYNNLINELLQNGIEPMVTLFHWDLPLTLQDAGAWTNPEMHEYFEKYARLAFENFGDRVKWWITFNEPLIACLIGFGNNPEGYDGDDGEYLCTHNILISHAKAYHLYDKEFRASQKGQIGITLNTNWVAPKTNTTEDQEAADVKLQFEIGWYAHPIFIGDYPPIMKERVGAASRADGREISRLPVFDAATIKFIKGTADFLGANHYTTYLATETPNKTSPFVWDIDSGVSTSQDPSWPGAASVWLKVVPWGFRKLLNWIKENYNNIPVIITENGYSDDGQLEDTKRIEYFKLYIKEMLKGIYEDACNVIGYIAWSLMDNFEWFDGYSSKFGIYHVDFDSPDKTRTPKASVEFFKELLRTRKLPKSR